MTAGDTMAGPDRTDRRPEPVAPGPGLTGVIDRASVFAYSLFIAAAEFPFRPTDVPPEHWQAAAGFRALTPREQAARERYFEQRASQALARAGRT